MLGTFLITWREAIEAALIIGILMIYLKKIGQSDQYRYVYAGIGLGIVASVGFAGVSGAVSQLFEGFGQEIFQVVVLLLAVVVLTYMVVWMNYNSKQIKGDLHRKADQAIATRKLWALGLLAFVGVFREGVETVLFLWGLVLQGEGGATAAMWGGALLGIGSAVLMAWMFFKGFGHLDLRVFFRVTGVLLIFIAAGMFATATGRLIGIGWLPGIIEPIWNTSWLLDERGFLGALFSSLFGYKSRPSLMEMLVYMAYFGSIFWWIRWEKRLPVTA